MSDVYAVIMAGGSGTRFWPASREKNPKQLLNLGGGDQSLLADTVRRILPLAAPDRIYIATAARLLDATARALPAIPKANLLAEPIGRNTAPCIGWAAHTIARINPEAIVMVLPSDHFIGKEDAFVGVLKTAIESARTRITTIGIVPTRAETGYGYIELGEALADELGKNVRAVQRFVEKPTLNVAEQYVRSGKYLWNAGMFFFRAGMLNRAISTHLPDLAKGLSELDAAATKNDEARALQTIFPNLPSISIDHGIMEKESNLAVVPGEFGWNDVGSWESAWELAAKDADGNALPPGAIAVDAKNNLVSMRGAAKRTFALVGVSDLVVVETDDAVLVMPRSRAQDVRQVVDAVKKSGKLDLL